MSFKGILKYAIYVFIGGWMFLLGIMVGRGTAPVSFDTTGFQNRLETIAREFGKPEKKGEKIDLHYYDALNDPIKPEILETPKKPSLAEQLKLKKTAPPGEPDQALAAEPETIPVKTSKKAATLKKSARQVPAGKDTSRSSGTAADAGENTTRSKKKGVLAESKATPKAAQPVKSRYTIQVAAYKSFKDAVTHMAAIEKKGFAAGRTKKEIGGVTWYRVRVGEFGSHEAAGEMLKKLNQAGINGMIIKEE